MGLSIEPNLESLKLFSGPLLQFTKYFDFGHIYDWLILDFSFIFSPNAYDKLLQHSCGIVRFYVSFIFIVFIS